MEKAGSRENSETGLERQLAEFIKRKQMRNRRATILPANRSIEIFIYSGRR